MNWLTTGMDPAVPQEAHNTGFFWFFFCNAMDVLIEVAILKGNRHHAASVTRKQIPNCSQ